LIRSTLHNCISLMPEYICGPNYFPSISNICEISGALGNPFS
jgi:hypothetical protein